MERNNIIVTGLSNDEELSKIEGFDFMQAFTEKEYIFIQSNDEPINAVEELQVSLSLSSHREINIANKKLMILEGEKSIALSYICSDNKLTTTSYNYPFNACIKLPDGANKVTSIKIYLLDVYPYVINDYTLYCNFVYLLISQKKISLS